MNAATGRESLFHDRDPLVVMPRCACGKWGTYVGNYDRDGYTIRCSGCLRSIRECKC